MSASHLLGLQGPQQTPAYYEYHTNLRCVVKMVDNLKQGTFSQRKCDCGKTTTKIIVFSLKMARFGKDTRVIFVSAWNTSRDSCANSQHKDVDDIRLHLFPPNELMAFMSQEPLNVPALGPRPVWSWIFLMPKPSIEISIEWKGKNHQGKRNKYNHV